MIRSENRCNIIIAVAAMLILIFVVILWWFRAGPSFDDRITEVGGQSGGDYFALLRDAREQIRASDGHLAGRYARLVAAKNPENIIQFLRNHFTIVPGGDNTSWRNAVTERRWGSRATLRGGVGTPRELADLLDSGLREMGYDAKVVGMQQTSRARNFESLIQRTDLSLDVEKYRNEFPGIPLDAMASLPETVQFWHRVAATVPTDKLQTKTFANRLGRLPTVQFVQDDTTRIANLWGADESPYVDSPVANVPRSGDTPWVTIKLQVAMANNPDEPITLAEGRWRSETIAGAQVVASFAPVARSPAELLTTPPRQFTSFVPVLRIVGSAYSGNDDDAVADTIAGSPFTINGQVFNQVGDTWLPTSGAIASGGDAGRIQTLNIKRAITGHYPWVGVDVDVLDSDGQSVQSVSLNAFSATVDSSAVPALMESNTLDAPAILFLLDVSSSVADEFRGSAANELVQAVAADIKNAMPKARFRIGIVSGNGASMLGWRDDTDQLKRDVGHFGMGSPLWRAAADAAKTEASLVVFLTDGHAADRDGSLTGPDDLSDRLLRAGPPFIVIGAVKPGETPGPAIETIAELSGGTTIAMDDKERVSAAVIAAVRDRLATYRFWLRADQIADSHDIAISLADRDVVANKIVIAPPVPMRSQLPGPVGLYLTIEANRIVSDRTLAGHPYRSRSPISETAATNARLGLFGEYTIFAEAGTPNAAQILDDLLTSRLSWQPVVDATDPNSALAALGQVWTLPRSAFTFNAPLPHESGGRRDHRVIDYGLRWWIQARRRVLSDGVEYDRESVDLLPNTRFYSTHPEPEFAFVSTLHASSYLSDIEASLYDRNTIERLGDRELAFTGRRAFPNSSNTQRVEFSELSSGWRHPYHFVIAASGDTDAGIAVDISTGSAFGLLRGSGTFGKGAGITESEANTRFDLVDRLLNAVGGAGGAPAAWAKLEKAKMEKLRFATILIIRMEPPDLLGMLREEACSAASGAIGAAADAGIRAATGSAGAAILDAISEYNDAAETLGMGGLESPVSIPGCE